MKSTIHKKTQNLPQITIYHILASREINGISHWANECIGTEYFASQEEAEREVEILLEEDDELELKIESEKYNYDYSFSWIGLKNIEIDWNDLEYLDEALEAGMSSTEIVAEYLWRGGAYATYEKALRDLGHKSRRRRIDKRKKFLVRSGDKSASVN